MKTAQGIDAACLKMQYSGFSKKTHESCNLVQLNLVLAAPSSFGTDAQPL